MALPIVKQYGAIAGKVCLVTGASRTLGAAIARRLAAYGGRVAINYHQSRGTALDLCAEIAAGGGTAQAFGADVGDAPAVERLVADVTAQLGPVDLLVNNVGPYVDTPFLDLPVADFDRVMGGNVRATFLVSQLVGRSMRERGQGLIVNIAATDAQHRSHSVYGLAKQGVVYLTEALALELAPAVRVNAVAPDLIADNEEMDATLVRRALGGTPLGKLVTRAEVAEVVCLLATPAFASMTGQTIVLDGGRTLPRIAQGPA